VTGISSSAVDAQSACVTNFKLARGRGVVEQRRLGEQRKDASLRYNCKVVITSSYAGTSRHLTPKVREDTRVRRCLVIARACTAERHTRHGEVRVAIGGTINDVYNYYHYYVPWLSQKKASELGQTPRPALSKRVLMFRAFPRLNIT